MEILDGRNLMGEWGMDHFRKGSTFGALSDQAICFLLDRGRVLSLADGEEVFHPGQAGDSFFMVIQGQLDYFRDCGQGAVPILSVAFGQQLGYVSMIGLFNRLGIAKARGPTIVLEVNSDLFYQMHVELPFDFGILMLNLSREMARTIGKVTASLAEARAGQPVG